MIVFVFLVLLAGVAGFIAGRRTADRWTAWPLLERFSAPEVCDEDSVESAEFADRVQSYADPAESRV